MPLQDCWSDRQLTVETRRSPTRRTLNNRHSGSLLCNLIWPQSLLDKVMLQVSNKIPQKWQCTFNRLSDIPAEEFQKLCSEYKQSLSISQSQREALEKATIDQPAEVLF